jgi:hypothetical protein
MADVHAPQPTEAHHAQAEATPQETAQQQAKPRTPAATYLGDNLISDAEMVYDQKRTSEYFDPSKRQFQNHKTSSHEALQIYQPYLQPNPTLRRRPSKSKCGKTNS